MGAKTHFSAFIKSKQLRSTSQRDLIVDVFLKTERHLSTQELFEIVKKKNPKVGYATVARTLKLMAEAGLCEAVDFGDGYARYEHKYKHDHHDHLICTSCGAFVEISSKRLESLQQRLVAQHGYVQVSHRLQIFGMCPKCQKTKACGR